MAIYNNGSYNSFSAFRQEDGKVLGRIKVGVKSAFPAAGGQDYRFFVEPLSPLPKDYEEAARMGFTGFMSRIGYDCTYFSSEKDAWQALSDEWGNQLVLFTPALRNNKYFVIDDVQKEAAPAVLEEGERFVPVPVFSVDDDPAFDGDVNKFCLHMAEGKPLPGLSKKYWDKNMMPPLVAASFRHPDASRKKMYVLFSPLHEDHFQNVVISEGGAYFETAGRGDLGFSVVDLAAPDIQSRCIMCRTAPLLFIPTDLVPYLKKDMKPVPSDYTIVPATLRRGFPLLRGSGRVLPQGMGHPARNYSRVQEQKTPYGGPVRGGERQVQAAVPAKPTAPVAKPVEKPAAKPAPQAAPRQAARPAFTEKDFLDRFVQTARQKGLLYDTKDLINFHVSVKSSRLVILAGMSGSGKSGLVRLYAETLGLPKEQLAMIPVRPSWMDDSDLLGYLDMKNMVYRPADTGLTELLVEAGKHPEKMYIVCFDEMNLARAEHYFAQFISALEREEDPVIRLYNPSIAPRIYNSAAYPAEIPVGRNVIFTGTVNVDESTYHFSDKILDRANVITLRQGKFRDLMNLTKTEAPANPEIAAGVFLGFVKKPAGIGLSAAELDFLDALNEKLQVSGLQSGIGYRVARQLGRYLENIPAGTGFTREDGLDCQTVQRIFTKLRGSAEQMKALVSVDEDGHLSGDAAAVLDTFHGLSPFAESRKVLLRKARELKLYDYTI